LDKPSAQRLTTSWKVLADPAGTSVSTLRQFALSWKIARSTRQKSLSFVTKIQDTKQRQTTPKSSSALFAKHFITEQKKSLALNLKSKNIVQDRAR
jgi:hypothetical protein